MGCGVSRLDGNGLVLPAKLRPIFLYRLEEIKTRRHARPLKNYVSTPSKKELLLNGHDHDRDNEDEKSSSPDKNVSNNTIMPLSPKDHINQIDDFDKNEGKENKIEDVKVKDEANNVDEDTTLTDVEIDGGDDDNEDDEDNMRKIGHDHDNDGVFPGSPSFRVYFKDTIGDDKHNDNNGQNDAFKNVISSDDAVSSKDQFCDNKKVVMKKGRKKKSFRKVLPKGGQVKKLLNYKSCYNSSPHLSHDHQTHLLTGKTTV